MDENRLRQHRRALDAIKANARVSAKQYFSVFFGFLLALTAIALCSLQGLLTREELRPEYQQSGAMFWSKTCYYWSVAPQADVTLATRKTFDEAKAETCPNKRWWKLSTSVRR